MTFSQARGLSRMTVLEVSQFLGLTLKTIKRYQDNDNAPRSVIIALALVGGELPSFNRPNDFSGWSFGQGYLWTPEGERFTSGDIKAGRLALLEMNRLHRAEVRERKAEKEKAKRTAKIIPFPNIRARKSLAQY